MMRFNRISAICLGAALFISGAGPGWSQVMTELVRKVQAAYVYNFARFIDWPASATPSKTLILGVMGDEALANALARVQGKQIESGTLEVIRLRDGDDLSSCHILFIGAATRDKLESIVATAGEHSILTVGSTPDFINRGGMVRFFIEEESVRFEICLARASRAGLKLSSKLLQVAKLVECGNP